MKRMSRDIGLAVLVSLAAACGSSKPDVDKVPDGQSVAVTKSDGGVVQGTITSRDDKTVKVQSGKTTKSIPKEQIADVKVVDKGKPAADQPPPPPVAKWREFTVADGTKLSLKLTTPINTGTNKVEDAVEATLAEPVTIEGTDVFPVGSVLKGAVAAVQGSGRVSGLASISLQFNQIAAAGRDDHYDIDATYQETAQSTKGSDAKKIGGGAAAGAVIGAILGGKGGAAKGAVIGGGAGTGVVLATKGKELDYPAGATLSVTLVKPIEVKIPIK